MIFEGVRQNYPYVGSIITLRANSSFLLLLVTYDLHLTHGAVRLMVLRLGEVKHTRKT